MLKYTAYAIRRMRRRKISTDLAAEVVTNPEQVIDERGRKIAQSKWTTPGGREHLLRVVYEESGDDMVIVTIYDTSKIRKYWRP